LAKLRAGVFAGLDKKKKEVSGAWGNALGRGFQEWPDVLPGQIANEKGEKIASPRRLKKVPVKVSFPK